ncbi:hypothetical protein T02_3391 [Trichinella nativa]|uniref:Uncharacterized protein n=1 Tax=Trichinella nativa TaxID=6335 RepID=A0A0V1L5D9_9BILA|nr:hypothetical protein T02_3391 [Trichinella nativa]
MLQLVWNKCDLTPLGHSTMSACLFRQSVFFPQRRDDLEKFDISLTSGRCAAVSRLQNKSHLLCFINDQTCQRIILSNSRSRLDHHQADALWRYTLFIFGVKLSNVKV